MSPMRPMLDQISKRSKSSPLRASLKRAFKNSKMSFNQIRNRSRILSIIQMLDSKCLIKCFNPKMILNKSWSTLLPTALDPRLEPKANKEFRKSMSEPTRVQTNTPLARR